MDTKDDFESLNSNGRPQPHLPTLPFPSGTTAKTPSKKRSLSDSLPVLGPSPKLKENTQRVKDEDPIIATPSRVSRRSVDLAARGLVLQMPPRDIPALLNIANRSAQSPPVDPENREAYGSPSSVLPRHSRGLDFARAATNLHHSTLAEQSSPDSSPTVTQKGFMPPSRRGSVYSAAMESPRLNSCSTWSSSYSAGDRGFFSRSVGSTNAMTSEASSSSSDEDDVSMLHDEPEDTLISTPQMRPPDGNSNVTPFAVPTKGADHNSWPQMQSPAANAFVNYRKNVLNRRQSRQSRGSLNNRSRTASPDTQNANGDGSGPSHPIQDAPIVRSPPSRRDSLSLGIGNALHITSSNESGEDGAFGISPLTPGVVRRPVTRRSNMLPKTKNFARVRAALQEETAPVDSEAKREGEVVRQVRVKDVGQKDQSSAAPTSPELTAALQNSNSSSEMSDVEAIGINSLGSLQDFKRDSINKEFWPRLNSRTQTPPPNFTRHRSSSGVSEDVSMGSPHLSTPPSSVLSGATPMFQGLKADTETGNTTGTLASNMPSPAEISVKAKNKRRRDDDFDVNSLKRRAVSPGVSAQNSPILGQSPASAGGMWNKQTGSSTGEKSNGSSTEERTGSTGSTGHPTPVLGPKRVGLQGMTDTSDGLMSMSIE